MPHVDSKKKMLSNTDFTCTWVTSHIYHPFALSVRRSLRRRMYRRVNPTTASNKKRSRILTTPLPIFYFKKSMVQKEELIKRLLFQLLFFLEDILLLFLLFAHLHSHMLKQNMFDTLQRQLLLHLDPMPL